LKASAPNGKVAREVWKQSETNKTKLMKTNILALGLLVLLTACAATGHIHPGDSSKLRIGMSREEVMRALGRPVGASADGNIEVLRYIEEGQWQNTSLQVRLVDGKVVSYGPEVPVSASPAK
jgi:hypothetical protein